MTLITDPFVNLGAMSGTGVACSDNGMIVYVIDESDSSLYKSTDGGVSFVSFGVVAGNLRGVACSDNGMIVYISSYYSLYKSVDGGVSFVDLALTGESYASVSCSSDGLIVYVTKYTTDSIYKSIDGGVSFVDLGVIINPFPAGVSCSDDGLIVYVIEANTDSLYKSTDGGGSFVNFGVMDGDVVAVSCSNDGLVAYVASVSNFEGSDDGGSSFVALSSGLGSTLRSVSNSSSGSVAYVINNNSLYRSGTPKSSSCLTPESKADITTGDLLPAETKAGIVTGDLLGAEAKSDIVTGDLLPANAKSDILTGNLLTAIPLPPTSGFPLNYARIGYDNALVNGSASATSDSVNSAKMLTPSTYDKWRPTADSVATLVGTLKQCNYVGVAAHNLGADGVTLTVKVSDGGAYTTVYSQLVTTNNALFIRFAEGAYSNVELTLTGSLTAEIGVVFLGLELEMMRPIFTGHKPANLNATDVMTPQVSDGGQFLGKQIVRQGYATAAEFQHLTDEWYRDKFQPFVEHAKVRPYFWAWNLLESPGDVVYGWTNSNIGCSYMGIRNWLQVSFDIEAHA